MNEIQAYADHAVAAEPPNEEARLDVLRQCDVLDTPPERAFDDLASLAALVCDMPLALVSLVDAERQWAKAMHGDGVRELPRKMSFCAHAILQPGRVLEVPDATQDPRFASNYTVGGAYGVRFYAGAPLVSPEGAALGTLCVYDRRPRVLTDMQRQALQALALQVVDQLERRRLLLRLEAHGVVDGMAPLASERAFERRLQEEWQRHARKGESLGLLLIDTRSGSEPIPSLSIQAQVVAAALRSSDFLGRLDEHVLAALLPTSGVNASMLVATRVRQALERGDAGQAVGPRMGLASMVPSRTGKFNQLVDRALHSLARAGSTGRSRIEAFSGW